MSLDPEERAALSTLAGLVMNGLASLLIVVVPNLLALPLVMGTRCGCGASAEARELRARCLALGLTPEQLRAREGS